MIRIIDNVKVSKYDVWKSEIRVRKVTPAIKKLLKFLKNPKEVKE